MDEYIPRSEYMERIGRIDDKLGSLDRRVSNVEKLVDKLNDIAITLKGMMVSLENMQKELSEQGKRLEAIEKEPGDNWKKFTWIIFSCAVTGIVGYCLGKLGVI